MKKKKVVKIVTWSVVGLLVVGYFGLSSYQKSMYLPTVRAGAVSYQDIDAYLSTSATIASPDSMTYYAPPNSQVKAVHFKLGDSVKQGDMIAEFDLTDLNNQIRLAQLTLSDRQLDANNARIVVSNAQTSLEQAKQDLERQPEIDAINAEIQSYQEEIAAYNARIQKLQRNFSDEDHPGYLPDNDDWQDIERYQNRITNYSQEISKLQSQLSAMPKVADMQREYSTAENAIKTAQNTLSSTQNAQATASINLQSLQRYQQDKGIVAQQDGVITEMNLVEGALSGNTTGALTVEGTNDLRATFKISKYDVGTIQVGQNVTLSLGELSYTGTVTKISGSAVKEQSASGSGTTAAQVPAEVTIHNPDSGLVIGLDFDMEIHTFSKKHTLAIPVEAIMTDRGGDFCYLLKPSQSRQGAYDWVKTYISTGKSSDLYVEVVSGVSDGDMVVMNPPTTLDATPTVLLESSNDTAMGDAAGSTDGTSEASASVSEGQAPESSQAEDTGASGEGASSDASSSGPAASAS